MRLPDREAVLVGDGFIGPDSSAFGGSAGASRVGWGGIGTAPSTGIGANPGGVGSSSTAIAFPALSCLMASSYCLTIRPIRLALLELPWS